MFPVPVGGVLRCERCGAEFASWPNSERARCSSCQHEQAVSQALRQDLARYGEHVAGEQARTREAQREAVNWEHWADQYSPSKSRGWIIPLLVATVVPGIAIVVAFAAHQLAWIGAAAAEVVGGILACLSSVGALAYVVVYFAKQRRAPGETVVPQLRVACPICGAPGELAVGQPARGCRFCRGAVLASAPVRESGRAAASAQRRHATFEKNREMRRAVRNLAAYGVDGNAFGAYALGAIWLVFLAVLVIFSYLVGVGSERDDQNALPYLWAFAAVASLIAAGIVVYQRRQAQRRRAAVEGVALQMRGFVTRGLDATLDWLDSYWPGDYDPAFLAGTERVQIETTFSGCPLLVVWKRSNAEDDESLLHVLFGFEVRAGAELPTSLADLPSGNWACGVFRHLRFAPQLSDCGLLLRADSELVNALDHSPEALDLILQLDAPLGRLLSELAVVPARAR